MEENGNHCCKGDQVVAFDDVQILVIASFEWAPDRVQDVNGEAGGQHFLQLEDCVTRSVEWQIPLDNMPRTLKKMKIMDLRVKIRA